MYGCRFYPPPLTLVLASFMADVRRKATISISTTLADGYDCACPLYPPCRAEEVIRCMQGKMDAGESVRARRGKASRPTSFPAPPTTGGAAGE